MQNISFTKKELNYKGGIIMFEETQEVIKALTLIQEICKSNPICNDNTCPFSKNGVCTIQDEAPEDWKIDTNPTIFWKAFE